MSKNNDLSFEEVDALLAYDPESGVLTWKVPRQRIKVGSVAGSLHHTGYIVTGLHGRLYLAHRLAWILHTGSWPSKNLDHINGQKDDNRIANLRECRQAENMQNAGKRSDNTSGVPGVVRHKMAGKWMAQIMVGGKQIYLGLFDTIEEAAAAREAAKQLYHTFNPNDR